MKFKYTNKPSRTFLDLEIDEVVATNLLYVGPTITLHIVKVRRIRDDYWQVADPRGSWFTVHPKYMKYEFLLGKVL